MRLLNIGSQKKILPLLLVVFLVLGVQLIKINRPYYGHFASYQGTVMASMARNMLNENFRDIFMPKTDALILTNEKTYHLNQYPVPSLLVAIAIKLVGGSFEFWGRFQAIIFNLLSVLFLAGIIRKIADDTTAAISSVLFLISPYSVIYGQAFMCESLALSCFLASLWLVLGITPDRKSAAAIAFAAVLFSISLVNRTHFILFLLPMICGVWWFARSLKAILIFLSLSLALPITWYGFTYYASIQNMTRTLTSLFFQASGSDILWGTSLFSLEYWKRIFDVFALNILTPIVFPFLPIGLAFALRDVKKFGWMFMMFGFGFLTIFLFPQKLMEHDFYLQGLFPFIIFFAANGIRELFRGLKFFQKGAVVYLAVLCLWGVSARYFLHPMFSCPVEEKNIVVAGKWVQSVTHSSDVLILAGQEAAALSFYTDRRAFSFMASGGRSLPGFIRNRKFSPSEQAKIRALETAMKDDIALLEFFRKQGANFFFFSRRQDVASYPELFRYLSSHFPQIASGDPSYYLFKL